jgi:pSer/pThr/pTyr-binding forkhead associated (FHA) protein/tetratricopeptide (TPR) repeat protein
MRLTVLKNHVPINSILVETPDATERYEIYVGRSEDCHVQIDDPLVSRHHFVLKNEAASWCLHKLSQLGVISVNGLMSNKMEVREHDEIKFGPYTLVVSEMSSIKSSMATQPLASFSLPVDPAPTKMPTPPAPMDLSLDEFSDAAELTPADEDMGSTEVIAASNDLSLDEEMPSNDGLDDSFLESSVEEESTAPVEENLEASDQFSDASLAEYSDESGMTESSAQEATTFFKAFVNYQLVLFGDYAPYDRYQIDTTEVYIGRDPKKCQIVLDDPEVSTVHAVLKKTQIDVTLEDLNSSNGTILNGERINKAHLSTGDEFVIGSTSFTLETKSDLLDAESERLMPVEGGQTIETEEIEEEVVSANDEGVDFGVEAPQDKSLIGKLKRDPALRKKVLIGALLLLVLWILPGDEENTPAPAAKAPDVKTDPNLNKNEKPKIQLSKELEQKRNMAYELGVSFFEQNKYFEALREFQTVMEIDPQYKKIDTYLAQTKKGLKGLEELEAQKRAEEERLKTKKLVEELLVKAREAVKERMVTPAENYFSQIIEKDPENIEVQQLKMELESWQKEQERIALEKAAKEAARKAMVDALLPGKNFHIKKEWYKAILKLEEFLRRKGTDEDLLKEGSDLLIDAKNQLASELGPLVGKARSLKEGQDLKTAYEAYLDVLKIEPTNAEALNEVDEIKSQLETRSRKIYREAIIAESLSLFNDAKEKFQEVQQISPTDSDYYKKASDKLKNYLE